MNDFNFSRDIRQHYADFLQVQHFDQFFTVTFKSPRREPYYALKYVEYELSENFVRKAFLCAEPHQTGMLHIHGVYGVNDPGWKPETSPPEKIEADFRKRFGISRIDSINSLGGVAGYCSKYILKSQFSAQDCYAVMGNRFAWT